MKNWYRIIPYISLGLASTVFFVFSQLVSDGEIRGVLVSVYSSAIFFFAAYLFYDVIKQLILRKERKIYSIILRI